MMRLGVVDQGRTVFDYGCGQGARTSTRWRPKDSRPSAGIPITPPRGPARPPMWSTSVLCSTSSRILRERIETLKAAWGFAKRSLCVSVMLRGKTLDRRTRPFRDGYVTSRGTFQKYFEQQELRSLVAGQ